jgi:hypothetical protein
VLMILLVFCYASDLNVFTSSVDTKSNLLEIRIEYTSKLGFRSIAYVTFTSISKDLAPDYFSE